MDTARIAIDLMLTQDEAEAEMFAQELEKLNNARKETENQIFKEAVEKIESSFLYKNNVMVVHGDNWHEGVIGIVASRLTEKYYRPCVVISVKDGSVKGRPGAWTMLIYMSLLRQRTLILKSTEDTN